MRSRARVELARHDSTAESINHSDTVDTTELIVTVPDVTENDS